MKFNKYETVNHLLEHFEVIKMHYSMYNRVSYSELVKQFQDKIFNICLFSSSISLILFIPQLIKVATVNNWPTISRYQGCTLCFQKMNDHQECKQLPVIKRIRWQGKYPNKFKSDYFFTQISKIISNMFLWKQETLFYNISEYHFWELSRNIWSSQEYWA